MTGDRGTVHRNAPRPPPSSPPVLTEAEAGRRVVLLTALQSALEAQGVSSMLARNQRLVLYSATDRPWQPSGPTDPHLHIFASDGTDIATTDGSTYCFASGQAHPADDPAGAARRQRHPSATTRPPDDSCQRSRR